MEAGKLNKRVTFFASVDTQSTNGEINTAWTKQVMTVWARIEPLTGRQLALAQANTITSTATHSLLIRYYPCLKGQLNYRVEYCNRFFQINSILDTLERHEELRIMVTEVGA